MKQLLNDRGSASFAEGCFETSDTVREAQRTFEYLRRLIHAQQQLHGALAAADAQAISATACAIDEILAEGREFNPVKLLPAQAKVRKEARVLANTVLEWQQQNRELGRNGLRLLRRLCGLPADPPYDGSGRLEASCDAPRIAVLV